jgi:hypothetical protein
VLNKGRAHKIKVMKIRFRDPFLHITAVGMLILTIITSGIPGVIYAFIFGSAISQLYLNSKERKQDEKL